MPNIINRMVTAETASTLDQAGGFIALTYQGLTVKESEAIRNGLAERGAALFMARNTLVRRLLAERGVELDGGAFKGNTAVIVGSTEQLINAAKLLTDKQFKDLFKKGKVSYQAALFEGTAAGPAAAAALADLPDRNTVNAMLLGVISGPARGLACVINAVPAAVARVLQARVDKEPQA